MAISSYNVVLKTSTTASGTYTKLVDIKDFPDLGSAPDTIEVTTLSDKMKRYVQGLQDTGSFEFTYNYTKDDFTKVAALDDNATHYFELDFGNDGAGGAGVDIVAHHLTREGVEVLGIGLVGAADKTDAAESTTYAKHPIFHSFHNMSLF